MGRQDRRRVFGAASLRERSCAICTATLQGAGREGGRSSRSRSRYDSADHDLLIDEALRQPLAGRGAGVFCAGNFVHKNLRVGPRVARVRRQRVQSSETEIVLLWMTGIKNDPLRLPGP
jgi:hypothetical protein